MANVINGTSTGSGGLITTGDDSGILNIQTNETTAMSIDASQRVAFVAGTAALPAITTTGDTNTGIFFPAADTIAFAEGGVEAARFDSAGNLGIGTTSPNSGAKLTVAGGILATGAFSATTGSTAGIDYSGGNLRYFSMGTSGPTKGGYLWIAKGADNSSSDVMTLDSSGNLLVGTTSVLGTSAAGSTHITGGANDGNETPFYLRNTYSTAGRYWKVGPTNNAGFIVYNNSNTGQYQSYGATSWTATSDERLKTNLVPIENAVQKVSTLRAVTGRYKTDEENVSRSFLIAQDVQAVLPEAVDVQDDEIQTLGLRYTETIPLLVAAIKEQQAIIESLKARLDAANL
jgi:hypothetical protein